MAARKEPEVFVFQDQDVRRTRKRKIISRDKPTKDLLLSKQTNVYEQQKQKMEEDGLDFRETMNEMRSLTAKSMLKSDKKGERDLLISLGAKPPPHIKVPYTRYLNGVKKRKKKAANAISDDNNSMTKDSSSDAVNAKKPNNRRSRVMKGKGRWKDSVKSLNPYKSVMKHIKT